MPIPREFSITTPHNVYDSMLHLGAYFLSNHLDVFSYVLVDWQILKLYFRSYFV
jgi:hypothetical protein